MCCSCGGADSRARHCTGETNGPSLKWQMLPNCHCEERSDVAISGRHSQSVQAAVKTYRPIASVAALTERLVQGYSTAQGHWCTARHPDVSLRGAKRRGNLAVPGRIVGKLSAKTQLPSRDCHVGLWPPRNDKSGTVIILSLPNTNRQHCAGPGCPLPYSALREAMGKTPLSTLNFRRPAGGYPRTGISSNPGRAPMPRRGSDCSRPDCAPRPPRATARCPAAGSARPTGHNTLRFP